MTQSAEYPEFNPMIRDATDRIAAGNRTWRALLLAYDVFRF
jgi:hypothetical protein